MMISAVYNGKAPNKASTTTNKAHKLFKLVTGGVSLKFQRFGLFPSKFWASKMSIAGSFLVDWLS